MGGEDAEKEPRCGSGIAEIQQILRLDKPADPDAVHRPPAFADWGSMGAQRIDRCCGGQHVLTFEKARDLGPTNRKRSHHQRAMRDRLIAGNSDSAAKRHAGPFRGQGRCRSE